MINILDSKVRTNPECIYDWEKGQPTGEFYQLMRFAKPYEIVVENKATKIRFETLYMGNTVHFTMPEWMHWLIETYDGRQVRTFTGYDIWHMAKVFAHKCIDMQVARSLSNLRKESHLAAIWREQLALVLSNSEGVFWRDIVRKAIINTKLIDEAEMINYRGWDKIIRLPYGYQILFKNGKKGSLIFSDRQVMDGKKLKGKYKIGKWIITLRRVWIKNL